MVTVNKGKALNRGCLIDLVKEFFKVFNPNRHFYRFHLAVFIYGYGGGGKCNKWELCNSKYKHVHRQIA